MAKRQMQQLGKGPAKQPGAKPIQRPKPRIPMQQLGKGPAKQPVAKPGAKVGKPGYGFRIPKQPVAKPGRVKKMGR